MKPEFYSSGQTDKHRRDDISEPRNLRDATVSITTDDIPNRGKIVVESVPRSRTWIDANEGPQGTGKVFKPKGRS